MATILELAQLSEAVYGGQVPDGWIKLIDSNSVNPNFAGDGYYGAAYEQVDANGNAVIGPDGKPTIVIANRGSDFGNTSNYTNLKNTWSDIQLSLNHKTQVQDDAVAFANFLLNNGNQTKGTGVDFFLTN